VPPTSTCAIDLIDRFQYASSLAEQMAFKVNGSLKFFRVALSTEAQKFSGREKFQA
jgi:hypothetical protein